MTNSLSLSPPLYICLQQHPLHCVIWHLRKVAELSYCLSNTTSSSSSSCLVADLAQNKYFLDESFLNYLEYLKYWQQPEYAKLVM